MTDKNINDLVSLKKHAPALDAELTAVFARYGLTYGGRSAKIGDGLLNFNIKLKYGTVEDDAARAERDWKNYCMLLNLPVDAFGRVIKISGVEYSIAGLDLKKRKRPVKLKRVGDGKTFVTTEDDVRIRLNLGNAIS